MTVGFLFQTSKNNFWASFELACFLSRKKYRRTFCEKEGQALCQAIAYNNGGLGSLDLTWQGWQDLNLRMLESKSSALPLGDTPTKNGAGDENRTHDLKDHNLAL